MFKLRLGTRKSPLALAQAELVASILKQEDPSVIVEIIGIQTKGDEDKKSSLQAIGGKGVFIKALEQELLAGKIDIAVHSAKDITSAMHPELSIGAVLEPEARHDSFVLTKGATTLSELPSDAKIATGSLRRQALIKALYPSFSCVAIRGNVQTRIDTAKANGYDAVVLSEVGLKRLNLDPLRHECDPKVFTPAPSQGVIAIQYRNTDQPVKNVLQTINDPNTAKLFEIERYVMQKIGFDCHIPFGFYIEPENDQYQIYSFIATASLSHSQTFTWTISQAQWPESIDKICNELTGWRQNHA